MTRRITMTLVAVATLGLIGLDLAASATPNPFKAPPLLAFGSGQTAGVAHCAALPPSR